VQCETVAKVLILNEKNEILTLRIGVHRLRPEKSHTLDLPGGIVDTGESERDAIVREVREEAGIVLDNASIVLQYGTTYKSESKSVTKLLYATWLNMTPEVTLSWEHEVYEWMSAGALLNDARFTTYRQGVEFLTQQGLIV